MSAVADVVSDVVGDAFDVVGNIVEPVAGFVEDAVHTVESAVENVVSEVGHAVEEVGQAVGKTVEAMAKDPVKALPLIAVAVIAPELAPLLWEGATAMEAAMVLNTGMQLANGVPPEQIATGIATSLATQGITSNLGLSTGFNVADKAIGNAIFTGIQGGDVNRAIGSSLGGSLVGMGINSTAGAIRNFDYNNVFDNAIKESNLSEKDAVQLTQGKIFQDAIDSGMDAQEASDLAKSFDAGEAKLANSQIFQDAVKAGFSTDEAFAIAKGSMDAENPLVSNPVAGASVSVEQATDVPENATPITFPSVTKEDLDRELEKGELTQEEYDRLSKYASPISKSEQEYVDPREAMDAEAPTEPTSETSPIDATKPDTTTIPYGAANATTNEDGSTVYTYDDGSTLTLNGNGEVLDVTDATDTGAGTGGTGTSTDLGGDGGAGTTFDNALDRAEEGDYQEDEYEEVEDPTSPSGFSLKPGKFGSPSSRRTTTRPSSARTARSSIIPKSISSRTTTSRAPVTKITGTLDSLGGGQYGSALTASSSAGNPEYSLFGEVPTEEPQGFASGGSTAPTQGIFDLTTTAYSPFMGSNADIMALKPGVIKGKINYALPGYPYGQEWKLAKEGGPIADAPEGHNPQFFSEGGLGSMKNTYVKGDGDGTSDSIAAMLADGEFVIPADVVSSLGNGSNDAGAKVLSEFLTTIRAHKRKANPKGLPPDSKGALGYLAEAKKKVKK